MTNEPKTIPAHEQPVQSIMHDALGTRSSYKPLKTLEDARNAEHGALVIEGDWGGTIYLSCPVKFIHATQEEIEALAEWMERQFWDCNFDVSDGEGGHGVYYVDAKPGTHILGGMGGGVHLEGLWVHDDIADDNLTHYGDEIIKRLKLRLPKVNHGL